MVNISNSDLNTISKFFEDFTGSVERILSEKIDSDTFDKIDFSINSLSQVDGIGKFKANNSIYKFNYSVEGTRGSFLVLLPEEFIAIASELIMGGGAEGAYKGKLTELEVNASLNLFNSMIDDMKITFKSLYSKDLIISSEPEMIIKGTAKYDEMFENAGFDFSMLHSLKLGNEHEFEINVLTNASTIKQVLINIDVLDEIIIQNIAKMMPKEMDNFSDISKIADIKINISAELGRIKIPIKQVLGLVGGSIIELDTYDNSDIKVFANGLEVARAQVVVVDDHFGIKITKIISPEERYKEI